MATNWQSRNAASRANRAVRINCRMVLYIDEVFANTKLTVSQKLKMIGQMVRDATVFNISRPVTKTVDRRTGRTRVTDRSKPGEFPKADTTRLMKDVFWDFDSKQLVVRVGSTLDYALFLEVKLNRSFLRRTLNDMLPFINLVFTQNASQDQIDSALNSSQVVANPAPVL